MIWVWSEFKNHNTSFNFLSCFSLSVASVGLLGMHCLACKIVSSLGELILSEKQSPVEVSADYSSHDQHCISAVIARMKKVLRTS